MDALVVIVGRYGMHATETLFYMGKIHHGYPPARGHRSGYDSY